MKGGVPVLEPDAAFFLRRMKIPFSLYYIRNGRKKTGAEKILRGIKGNLRIWRDTGLLFLLLLRRDDTVITDRPPFQRVGGLPASQAGAF